MNVTSVGIDLPKNVFSVYGVGRDGKVLLSRSVGRGVLSPVDRIAAGSIAGSAIRHDL